MLLFFDADDVAAWIIGLIGVVVAFLALDKVATWLGSYYEFFASILIKTGIGYKATIVVYIAFLIVLVFIVLKYKLHVVNQLYIAPLHLVLCSLFIRLGLENRSVTLTSRSWEDLLVFIVAFIITACIYLFHKKMHKTRTLIELYIEKYPTREITKSNINLFEMELNRIAIQKKKSRQANAQAKKDNAWGERWSKKVK